MPYLSLTSRATMHAPFTDETQILLVTITHADLADPIRLSSDPTERITTDPLVYGTVSNGETYLFVIMGAMVPDDQKGVPPRTTLTFDNVAAETVALARSFLTPATVDLSVVFASGPDLIVQQFTGLQTTKVNYDESSITFEISREPFFKEPYGSRQTKSYFPGLHTILSS